ncbi:MAG: hypothetical protein V4598_06240 [Bdellovibrionota bacterium]
MKKQIRKIIRKNFNRIPDKLRARLERRMFQINLDGLPSDFIFKLAETKDELEQAFTLLHDSYVREGFMKPKPSGMRVTPYHALPTTTTLIAKVGSKVIATVSLIRQTSLGLPIQQACDLSSVIGPGQQAVEISALAIHPEYRGKDAQILFWLSKYVLQYSYKYFGVDYMFVAIGPWNADLYENIILFKRLHFIEKYAFSNNAPAVVAYLDLKNYSNDLLSVYWNAPPERNVYAFIMVHQLSPKQFQFPKRAVYSVSDPVLTPELLKHFLGIMELTDIQLATLHGIYKDFPEYKKVLPPTNVHMELQSRTRKIRFQVNCPAIFSMNGNQHIHESEVLQVSESGFMARVEHNVNPGDEVIAQVRTNTIEVIELHATAVWSNGNGLSGFRLDKTVASWEKFIAHLKNSQNKVSA